ncbi:MAG: winged helix-turn-helix domain-containing protein [Proteobacteria bacterium]|nr:winged helix-turn-helix domain-containing protein [Pseudomonadota bacterium]
MPIVVLELHECPTTLTRYCKALRSHGLESQTRSVSCCATEGCAFDTFRLILLLPEPRGAVPSTTLRRLLPCVGAVPVLALLNTAQHARPTAWFDCGVHVVTTSTITYYALAQQIRVLLELSATTPSVRTQRQPNLTRIERRILQLIASQPGRPFSRSAILEHIYDDHRVVCERTVDAHIKNLRRKLKTAPGSAAVRSVYGEGYLFEPAARII